MVDSVRSEDTMIFLALSPRVTNMGKILNSLKLFIDEKQSRDPTDRFNIITFIDKGPIYFEDFTYNGNFLLRSIQDLIPQFGKMNMAGGIFLSITFIIDVFKIVGGKTFRLIILTDKKTPHLKNVEVVQNLINNVLDFPFFIDIVRIGTDDPREDLKLMRFVKSTSGSIYYTKNEKESTKVLHELSAKKEITTSGFGEGDKIFIDEDSEPFFQNLADDVLQIPNGNSKLTCQICREPEDLYKCPKCGTPSHKKCLALWAKFSNIGLPQLFRCQNCFNLLKLDKQFIIDVQSGKEPDKLIKTTEIDWLSEQDALLREKDTDGPKIIEVSEPFGFDDIEDEDEFFDFNEEIEDVSIIWCPKCGKMLTSEYKFCNNCGQKIR